MSDFNYTPSYSSQLSVEPRVIEARFGDGYAQRAADGINTNREVWSLSFNGKSNSDADTIETFLKTKGGHTPFTWTPNGRSEITVICKSFRRTYTDYGISDLQMTFEQVFDS